MTQAVILCGGQGLRLKPVLGDLPKVLAPIKGKPCLYYVLKHLKNQGVRDFILCVGFGADQVVSAFPSNYFVETNDPECVNITYSIEKEPLGTAGALKKTLPLLKTDPVLVQNGDTLCKYDLQQMVETHKQLRCGFMVNKGEPFGQNRWWEPSGVYLCSRKFIESLPDSGMPLEGCQPIVGTNCPKCIGAMYQPFLDIGTPERYALAEAFLTEQGLL